jgi:hypothetical protein
MVLFWLFLNFIFFIFAVSRTTSSQCPQCKSFLANPLLFFLVWLSTSIEPFLLSPAPKPPAFGEWRTSESCYPVFIGVGFKLASTAPLVCLPGLKLASPAFERLPGLLSIDLVSFSEFCFDFILLGVIYLCTRKC